MQLRCYCCHSDKGLMRLYERLVCGQCAERWFPAASKMEVVPPDPPTEPALLTPTLAYDWGTED